MAYFTVTDRKGVAHTLEGVEGWRLMELLRDYKIGVEGVCGGACDCGTCHVEISPEWAAKLPAPRDDELDKLDELPLIYPTSRLSCQVLWQDNYDGLSLKLVEAA